MDPVQHHGSSLKLRLIIALIMLIFGFAGVVLTDIFKNGAWNYWQYITVIYALLSLYLSMHLKIKGFRTTLITIWHEIAHWVGLMGAIVIASYFVKMGLVGRFEVSLLTLLLLALATYLAGIYIEPTLIFIGIMLGLFAIFLTFLDAYLYNILLPLTLIVVIVLVFFIHHAHKKLTKI